MFEKIEVFRMAQALSQHAGQRQSLIARNVANVDTPGYRASDLTSFAESYATDQWSGQPRMRATRASHLTDAASDAAHHNVVQSASSQTSVEEQMLNGVNAMRSHERAISIYKSGLNILRSSIRTS